MAVWSPRCQSDKELYSQEAARIIKEQEGIEIIQGTVKELQISNYKSQIFSEDSNFPKFKYTVSGIITENGKRLIANP
ncbi:MAG: FAD-dependent oxidoreductase [Ignavibacteria bacterium]